jgi:periplasmic protein CpxP/Spy
MTPIHTVTCTQHTRHNWRLLLATASLAMAAVVSQTAWAAPGEGPGMGPGMPGMEGGAHGHHRPMQRMLDAAKATPEQRSQIEQITQTAMADIKGQHEATRQLHEQMQALFTQPNIDAAAVEAVRQQLVAQHDAASKRLTQMRLDVSRVLSPEQRQQIAQRMGKMRDMHQRHRSERRALERGTP